MPLKPKRGGSFCFVSMFLFEWLYLPYASILYTMSALYMTNSEQVSVTDWVRQNGITSIAVFRVVFICPIFHAHNVPDSLLRASKMFFN